MFLEHRLIKPSSVELREYQVNIAKTALSESTLVVLPTGLGKTVVALILVADKLLAGEGKVLFMAPTKPLVEQHSKFLSNYLLDIEPTVFTGEVPPARRGDLWRDSRLVVSTPQVIENDLNEERISLRDVSLIVFDEAHRAVGDYAYVSIGKRFAETAGLALGLTASPGSDVSKIAEVCENLAMTNVEIRSELDEDVASYTQVVKTEFIGVGMPEDMGRVIYLLQRIMDEQVAKLSAHGYLDPKKPPTTRDLLEAGKVIRAKLNVGTKNYHLFQDASAQSLAMKMNHGIELAQTQGKGALESYFSKLVKQGEEKGGPKASRDLIKDARFQQARTHLHSMQKDHPKLEKIVPILRSQFRSRPDSKAIVFTHYRDTCELLTQKLTDVEGVRPVRFVGQASKGEDHGLNQKEQKEIIEGFRAGVHNVLVATSIAEEGLDIPATDLVVFYEPVPSEIRTIQRRGRTGRKQAGRVIIFVTRDTKDEAYLWSSRRKEMQMRKELDSLRRKLRQRRGLPDTPYARPGLSRETLEKMMSPDLPSGREELARKVADQKGQKSLAQYEGTRRPPLDIAVSTRIRESAVAKGLEDAGFNICHDATGGADIVISERVSLIFRTIRDFIIGLNSGTIISDLDRLRGSSQHPILVVQGEQEGEGDRRLNSAIYDFLNGLISRNGLTVLSTASPQETASAIKTLYGQEKPDLAHTSRSKQTSFDSPGGHMFLVQGLPNVSATLSTRLMKRFGSPDAVSRASVEELMKVDGIAKIIAEGIHNSLRKMVGEELD